MVVYVLGRDEARDTSGVEVEEDSTRIDASDDGRPVPGPAAEIPEVDGIAAEVAGGAAGGAAGDGIVGRGVIVTMAFCNFSRISTCTALASMGFGEMSVLLPGLSDCLSVAFMIEYRQVGMRLQIPESKQFSRTCSTCEVEEWR